MKKQCKNDPKSFIGAILAQDKPEHRFDMILTLWGANLEAQMVQKSILKSYPQIM